MGIATVSPQEPTTFTEAMESPEREMWIRAMDDEISSHDEIGTWELVEKPCDRKIIGSRWTFKLKENEAGLVVKFKARLVAQGYNQKYEPS